MMEFLPKIKVTKSGDIITVAIRQRYKPEGYGKAFRWRIAGQYSLEQLKREEMALKRGWRKKRRGDNLKQFLNSIFFNLVLYEWDF